jgi:RND family efflux transporter MFP subunit
MKLQRGILSLLTVLVLFLAVGAAVAWRLLSAETDPSATASGSDLPDIEGVQVGSAEQFMGAQPVEGVEVVRDTLWVRVIASGEAQASRRSPIATRAAGVVQRVFVRENAVVREGDLLVQLDTVEAQMRLTRAENQLFRARIQFEERMLFGGDVLDPAERESRERILTAELLTVPELDVAEAQMAMEFTRVRAPFAGRIADLQAVEGAYMGNGGEVLTLMQLDPMRVEVNVLEGEIGYLAPGRRAQVRFNALPGETFEATVESVNPLVDRESRAGRVTLTLPNPQGRILPGFYAWVSLDAEAFADRVLVPREAVVQRGDQNRDVVFTLKNGNDQGMGLADWKYVAIGRRNDTHVEIIPSDDTSMLEPGEIVLTNGHHYLAHDTAVQLVENVVAAGGRPGR